MKQVLSVFLLLFIAASFAGCTERNAEKTAAAEPEGEPLELEWVDLLPEGEEERLKEIYDRFYNNVNPSLIGEGMAGDTMTQIGTFNSVKELDGAFVKIPGFIVPLDLKEYNKVSEFLLVPYFGACIHNPPPPPNQIIHVIASEPVTVNEIWMPFWLEGVLTVGAFYNDPGNAAYQLSLTKAYEYEE